MNSGTRFFITLSALATCWLAATQLCVAQPKGWPCDYGYRPGNTWFYRSTSFKNGYSETVVRDSLGADGAYWVYVTWSPAPGGVGDWFRIDSACTFDLYNSPQDSVFDHWFVATADSGQWWAVDTADSRPYHRGFIYDVFVETVFGKRARTKEVVYYVGDEPGTDWYYSEQWAEGIGIIRMRSHPSGYDEIVGAIIDGRKYGVTSGVEEPAVETGRMTLWPTPTRDAATLRFRNSAAHAATVTIHDMLGRTVRRLQLNEHSDAITTVPLDVSGFAPGIYMVTIDAGGALQRAPLVVTR